MFFQLHFGAVYNAEGEYGWLRSVQKIRETFEWEMKTLGTDYADFGFLHCVDDDDDYEALMKNGVFEFAKAMKAEGACAIWGSRCIRRRWRTGCSIPARWI